MLLKRIVKVLSTVFVIENFYAEAMHSNVSFKAVNYDFDRHKNHYISMIILSLILNKLS